MVIPQTVGRAEPLTFNSKMSDKQRRMKIIRGFLILLFTAAAGSGDAAHGQDLFGSWHLKMSDLEAKSRVSVLRGERLHDAQGYIRVSGVFAERKGSEEQPEELFFDVHLITTLLRGTEYDPDFLRTSSAAGYRHRRKNYTVDLYGEHLRRMNTDRGGRRNTNFFGVSFADPEFTLARFGKLRRFHGRAAGGVIDNENGFKGETRYQLAFRYDYKEFEGRGGRTPLPKGQIFIEGEADAIDAPGGLMADLEVGLRFVFFPESDNSLSIGAKLYDSKNPFGHADDGIRIDLELEGSHAGELFRQFAGNTAGEIVVAGRGEDIATEVAADFDLVRVPCHGKNYLVILDSLQRATWGKLNKIEYNLQTGIENSMDEKSMVAGLYLDHRSTHGLDRSLPEKNYNIVRVGLKSAGWDPGRENEIKGKLAAHFSFGKYIENSFKKTRDWDARAGFRVDAGARKWHTWDLIPYLKGTLRNATSHGRKEELTAEAGLRFNGNALFARWTQDAYLGEGGMGGLALRF